MTSFDQRPHYKIYLLTIWKEGSQDAAEASWRFRLEDPSTGLQRGFADLEALVAALRLKIGDQMNSNWEERA